MSFWQGFKAGVYLAAAYSLVRNPGSCLACAGCLLLLAAILVIVLVMFILSLPKLLVLAVAAGAVALYYWQKERRS